MKIGIIGGTGLIGSYLQSKLIDVGHDVVIFTRKDIKKYEAKMNLSFQQMEIPKAKFFEGLNVLINLSGEPILKQRWSESFKKKLKESRVEQTQAVVEEILKCKNPPTKLINSSAIGFYGSTLEEHREYTEESKAGKNFLAHLCELWEEPLEKLQNTKTKYTAIRIGIVLSKKGGALSQVLPVFKMGLGGVIGTGKQIMSWIHIDDLVNAILFLLKQENVEKSYNLTAPNPVSNQVFSKELAKSLFRPCLFPTPSLLLKTLYGEGAEIILQGQKVYPQNLLKDGFSFQYETVQKSFQNILH